MQSKDFKWYIENMSILYEQYGSKFLAIKSEKVLGSYNSYAEAVRNTLKTEEIGSFIVQQCGVNESVYTNYISSFNFCA